MESKRFVSAYTKDATEAQIFSGDYSAPVQVAQELSYYLGRYLHDNLNEQPPDTFTEWEQIQTYDAWLQTIPQLENEILSGPLDKLQAWNEINFHSLNRHMFDLWAPIFTGSWLSEEERVAAITIAQNSLALEGLKWYHIREKLKQDYGGTEHFFEPAFAEAHERHTGVLQEFDAGIILLDIMRHDKNITVVPAPMQFEHGSNPSANVDFLVVDFVNKRAVGAQVKTNVTSLHLKKYDQERVVLIDGTIDLGNVKVMRIKKGTSKEAPKPWPGIISAKQVHNIQVSGKRAYASKQFTTYLLRQKFLAKQLVGSLKVDYGHITQTINERIRAKL